MSKTMLIDAAHPEETRVAITDSTGRLCEFDFESSTKETNKGNIYLAKVARVEPSLQAAFVDYGGNRHGFLAFGEIHPDYFRIPIADREALKAEMMAAHADDHQDVSDTVTSPDSPENLSEEVAHAIEGERSHTESLVLSDDPQEGEGEDETSKTRAPSLHRNYKIQEVIQKNQILLVQVVKEERGGKGAALTTYLSIAGRYGVLMPNSPRTGGISRKISSQADRTRLRKILDELNMPEGMGLIVRTAGSERTKAEIKRDAEYLMRSWNEIREATLQSVAPALVYQEDEIIKRAVRDLYNKDIEEVMVAGDEGYKTVKNFMRMMMPSHAKRVKHYKDADVPLFHRYRIEAQIDSMHSPVVHLPSGGSIVIHPTEALVSIDINSGRSTRERHIEETALKTNLEAADEIALQVRLRDLAGLIVIDFIDMDDPRHTAAVERRVREAFKNDRARVQMNKISNFGLMEISRQRLRPSILEISARPCPHCQSTGYVRSTESVSLSVLRALEDEAYSKRSTEVVAYVPHEVAFYLLNSKRPNLMALETRYGLSVQIIGDSLLHDAEYRIERRRLNPEKLEEPRKEAAAKTAAVKAIPAEKSVDNTAEEPTASNAQEKTNEEAETIGSGEPNANGKRRRSRRRRGRRGGNGMPREDKAEGLTPPAAANDGTTPATESAAPQRKMNDDHPLKTVEGEEPAVNAAQARDGARRSRYRRGGRNHRNRKPRQQEGGDAEAAQATRPEGAAVSHEPKGAPVVAIPSQENSGSDSQEAAGEPKKKTRRWWKRLLDS
ncbi:MAG: ribonuclease E/G [Holosporales bacterium]